MHPKDVSVSMVVPKAEIRRSKNVKQILRNTNEGKQMLTLQTNESIGQSPLEVLSLDKRVHVQEQRLQTYEKEIMSLRQENTQVNQLNRKLIERIDDIETTELTLKEDTKLFNLIEGIEKLLDNF